MSIGSCNKIKNDFSDDELTRIGANEAMTEDSSVANNLEKVTDSYLEIENLTREPESLTEDLKVRTSHIKNKSKKGAEHVRND